MKKTIRTDNDVHFAEDLLKIYAYLYNDNYDNNSKPNNVVLRYTKGMEL